MFHEGQKVAGQLRGAPQVAERAAGWEVGQAHGACAQGCLGEGLGWAGGPGKALLEGLAGLAASLGVPAPNFSLRTLGSQHGAGRVEPPRKGSHRGASPGLMNLAQHCCCCRQHQGRYGLPACLLWPNCYPACQGPSCPHGALTTTSSHAISTT